MKALKKTAPKLFALNLILALVLLAGCFTVPETGRQSLILIDVPTEMQLGLSAYDQIKSETTISDDPRYNRRVLKVGRRIAAVADQPDYGWEFTVFEDDSVNAWCLPGGKIGIYTGLFKVVKNEGQLATVIAHEIGHAIARHGAERISHGLLLSVGAEVIAASMDSETEEDLTNIEQMKAGYGIASNLFVMLPFSRKHEYEADRIGLMLMAKAGYDPRDALKMWEAFSTYHEEQGGGTIEYLSTHPSDEKRIAEMKQLMPEALQRYYNATGQEPPPEVEREFPLQTTENLSKAKVQYDAGQNNKRKTFIGVKIEDDE